MLTMVTFLLAQGVSLDPHVWVDRVLSQGPLFTLMAFLIFLLHRGELIWKREAEAIRRDANERIAELKEDRDEWKADAKGSTHALGTAVQVGEVLASSKKK